MLVIKYFRPINTINNRFFNKEERKKCFQNATVVRLSEVPKEILTCSLPLSILSVIMSPLCLSSSNSISNCDTLSFTKIEAKHRSEQNKTGFHWERLYRTQMKCTSSSLNCLDLSCEWALVSASTSSSKTLCSKSFALCSASSLSLWHCRNSSCMCPS